MSTGPTRQTKEIDLRTLPPETTVGQLMQQTGVSSGPTKQTLPTPKLLGPSPIVFPLGAAQFKLELSAKVTQKEWETMLQLIDLAKPSLITEDR